MLCHYTLLSQAQTIYYEVQSNNPTEILTSFFSRCVVSDLAVSPASFSWSLLEFQAEIRQERQVGYILGGAAYLASSYGSYVQSFKNLK